MECVELVSCDSTDAQLVLCAIAVARFHALASVLHGSHAILALTSIQLRLTWDTSLTAS